MKAKMLRWCLGLRHLDRITNNRAQKTMEIATTNKRSVWFGIVEKYLDCTIHVNHVILDYSSHKYTAFFVYKL